VVEGYGSHLGNSGRHGKGLIAWVVGSRIIEMIVVPFLLVGNNLLGIVIETFHLRYLDFVLCVRPCRVEDSMSRLEEGE